MSYTVRDYDLDDPRDAERVAAMFNAWDPVWPGGFTRGVPNTGERIFERKRRMCRVAILVAQHGDELVGYCDVEAQPGQTDLAYIDLLGASPDHHGKGVGRMLLREAIRRVVALGYREVTLGTWPGNTKAVPLYKKTGFQWVPETDVWMRNFLPGLLNSPVGRAFFADRDWYACHERELAVAPDDVRWNGMRVYPYRFRDGDDLLAATFEDASGGPTALETSAFRVSCCVPVEEAAAGETYPIRWEIAPKGGRTLDVVLLTEADAGLEVAVQERLSVARETVLERELRVAADAVPRPGEHPAHAVRSTLIVDGQPLVLQTGVRVVRPVEIEYAGQCLVPGRRERVTVRMRSRLERDLEGRLVLDAHEAVGCPEPSVPFTLPARSWTDCELTVCAAEPGCHVTRLRCEAGTVSTSRPVAFRALSAEGAQASVDAAYDERAWLETLDARLDVALRGGQLSLHGSAPARGLMAQDMGELGPPFMGWRLRPPLADVRVDRRPDGTALVTTLASDTMPGLVIERATRLVGGGLVRVDFVVRNTTDAPIAAKLKIRTSPWLSGYLAVPSPHGLIREPLRMDGGWPESESDVLPLGVRLAENWAACEEDGAVAGLVWEGEPETEFHWSSLPQLTYELGAVPANGLRAAPPVYLVGGSGTWETVRGWWRKLVQPSGIHEERRPDPVRVLEVRAEPAVLRASRESVRLEMLNRRGKVLRGTLSLRGDWYGAEPAMLDVLGVDRDHPLGACVDILAPDTPSAGFVNAVLDRDEGVERFRLPFMRLGASDAAPSVTESEGTFLVDNGWMRLRVAPAFYGSLCGLERGGVNHLFSSWPEARAFEWMNPWYGGVHPAVGYLWDADRRMPQRTDAEPVARTGARGIPWAGVRVRWEPEHKDLRWLRLDVEYLTTAGSNVVAVVQRWVNRTASRTWTDAALCAWVQPGGERAGCVEHWEREGERRERRPGGYPSIATSGPWAAVEDPATGDFVLVATPDPTAHAGLMRTQAEGPHLGTSGRLMVEPNGARERLTWLVLGQGVQQAEAYAAALKEARELP